MNRLWLLIAILFPLFPSTSLAASIIDLSDPYPVYFGTVQRIIDGDTMVIAVELWPGLTGTYPVRIRGIDTPETTHSDCPGVQEWGLEAKAKVEKLYDVGSQVRLEHIEIDSFGRVLADISRWRSDRWLDLGHELVDEKLAVEWMSNQSDVPWCVLSKSR